MGTYTGTDDDDTIIPGSISDGVTADPPDTTPDDDDDTLVGLGGDDILDGGFGADVMQGGLGDDIYYVDNAFGVEDPGDVATEDTDTAAGGVDEVRSTISFTLGFGLENLVLLDSDDDDFDPDIDGTGNELDNVLTGNSGDNVLDGAGG
ncbi:Alkaline phosphatase [Rubellimicrobium mesophilum DSM 19309]|uniref:Alkaline phosphatase n=1 Tax=Rubellimicrobium mesophilum DSM 19309 TaxID=442562 RepID=A0A017HPK5_9RHOB|nr:hypothetical protein [Rubellimicrobium mesophilum]EYD76432.1 Alkaline phosphatase [Rubellimicrobium mesophilum DSM 19309]